MKRKSCPTNNLSEENKIEITSLISYINDVLVIRIKELTDRVRYLESKQTLPEIDLEISDDEN